MAKPQAVLKNNPYSAPTFWYPEDLGGMGNEPYVIFDVRDPVVDGEIGGTKGTLALPFPNDVSSTYGMQYTEETANPDAVAQAVAAMLPKDADGKSVIDTIKSGVDAAGNALGDVWGNIIAKTTLLGGSTQAELAQRRIAHPHAAVAFKGVGFRKFNMSYDFLAKNQAESVSIHNIIYNFKYHMHPELQEGASSGKYFLYPDEFIIGFFAPAAMANGDEYLFKIKNCVLDTLTASYNGSGVPVFFRDTGAPVHIKLTLSFIERQLLTKTQIQEGC